MSVVPLETLQLALLVVSDGRSFTVELPDGQSLTVGKGRDAAIRVKDERVAAVHVSLRAQDDGAEVTVVSGGTGAQLNEVQFTRAARMKVGDQLTVGRAVLVLQRFSAPPAPPFAPVMSRRAFSTRLAEEPERGRPFVYAIARLKASKGLPAEILQDHVGSTAILGVLGAEALQVLAIDTPVSHALLDRLAKPIRGERPQVGYAQFPDDGADAEALVEVALSRMVEQEPSTDALAAFADAGEEPLFQDPVMVRLVSMLDALPTPLLMQGERGVGKTLMAALMHQRSGRTGPLIKISAATTTPQQLSAAVEQARQGTLLLTHAERLIPPLQKLLEKDLPVIATAERELGRFLESSVRLPALRDRRSEVLPLAEHFLSRCRRRHGRPRLVLSEEVRPLLEEATWPGNLRQLRNAIETAVLISESDEIRPDDLPPEVLGRVAPKQSAADFRSSLKAVEKDVLLKALAKTRWNVSRAAEELGLPRRTVVYRMAKLGLKRPDR
ncbi:MAG: helix-turn-helix domain-containing protein [Myxococcaceae bacterium]